MISRVVDLVDCSFTVAVLLRVSKFFCSVGFVGAVERLGEVNFVSEPPYCVYVGFANLPLSRQTSRPACLTSNVASESVIMCNLASAVRIWSKISNALSFEGFRPAFGDIARLS